LEKLTPCRSIDRVRFLCVWEMVFVFLSLVAEQRRLHALAVGRKGDDDRAVLG